MARPKPPTKDDGDVWRSVTADVTPLAGGQNPAARPEPVGPEAKAAKPRAQPAAPAPRRPSAAPPLMPGVTPGVDRRTAERLRRGQLPIEARLDLHGQTRADAHRALASFLAASWDSGRRVVLVITGKGQGILKDAVPRWMNEGANRTRILAIATAQPKHGGDGALYVLLRRRR